MHLVKFAAAALLLVPSLLDAAEPPRRILFIGNSYTGQVRESVTRLVAASAHREAHLEFITPGGKTLEFHGASPKTLEQIRTGNWDIVVLQDQSQTPALFPMKFLATSKSLHAVITASGARTAYYQTWGRRDGDPGSAGRFPTYEQMQAALTKSYREAARRDGATLVPAGEAWRRVRTERPALGRSLYKKDGSHPSSQGAFLVACCVYASLFAADPAAVAFDGALPPNDAHFLRKTAQESVRATTRSPVPARP